MEYHNDRFTDFSLMIFLKSKLIALLPANIKDNAVISHQGLTYGGLIIQPQLGVSKAEAILEEIITFLKKNEISKLLLKQLPFFYHQSSNFELESILFEKKALIIKRNLGSVIHLQKELTFHKTKLKNYRKAEKNGFQITKNSDFTSFWNKVLVPRLQEKHQTKPVHNLEEITLLANRFPNCIYQYNLWLEGKILAGITIFKDKKIIKSQYGATTNLGEKYRALDYLFLYIAKKYKADGYLFFDQGVIEGNYSLLKQKEEHGGAPYVQDFYQLKLS